MSATPRTDEAEEQYWLNKCIKEGEVLTSRAVHSDFARRLELEINQLEWEIRKLKAAIYDLNKDGKRLDWILSGADRRDMGLVLYRDYPLETREDIDKAMEESQ